VSDVTGPATRHRGAGASRGPGAARLNRRALLGVVLGGALAAGPAIAQIDGTPPAAPMPVAGPAGETIADRAAALGYDAGAIARFVAEEIHYEAYDGALRGAEGTLWARAGNAVDQATLLLALLAAAQVPARLAFGALTPAGEARLATIAAPDAAAARAGYDAALTGSLGVVSVATPVASAPLTADQQAVVDLVTAQATALQDRAATLAGDLAPMLAGALDRAGIALPDLPASPLTALERSRHAWVQIADGPVWTDLDPSDPDAAPGDTLAAVETTADAVPDDLLHRVRLSLDVEELSGGAPTRREALGFEAPASRFLNQPVALAMTGRDDLKGVGVTITDIFSGTVTLAPCLVAGDDVVTATQSVVFGAGEGGVLGALGDSAGGLADGETLAVWLVATVTSPTEGPVTIERALLDRVGVAARATGTFDPTAVAPVTIATDTEGKATVAELAGLTVVSVDLARLPSLYAARDTRSADLLGDLHLFGASLGALRTAIGFPREAEGGYQSYPAAPCLSALEVRLIDAADAAAGVEVAADLLHQRRALAPLAGTSPGGSPHVLAGVLDQVAEQVLIEPLAGADAGNVVAPTVGMVFAEAARAGVEIVAVTDPAALDSLGHGADAVARMRAAVEAGLAVVVPAAPVSIGGREVAGWWLVDPVSGRVRDEMDNGRGYAGARLALAAAPDYAALLNNVRRWAGPYTALGRCLAIVVAAAVRASDYSGSQDLVNAGIETFKNLDPNATKGCFG
jgi:hypothetical protein